MTTACRQAGRSALPTELQAKRFYISGYVLGVGYRYFALRAASRLRVSAYVRDAFLAHFFVKWQTKLSKAVVGSWNWIRDLVWLAMILLIAWPRYLNR